MSNATCFDPSTLKDYLLGKLSDEQSDAIANHLEDCLSCEATISQLDRASDTLTDGLKQPVLAEPVTDAELKRALAKVQSLESAAASRQASEVSKTSEVSTDRSPVLRDYRLLEPLGAGGMGQVFKAVHTRLDRLVAVKLLPARRLGDEQAVARFQREMRVIGQLSHPAIVQATDAGEVDGTHFLVMEFVEGFDLNAIAKACGPLSIADACEIARQAALGLEYAHQQGIVHRDIKPSNLMLSRETRVQSRESNSPAVHSQLSTLNSQLSLKILDLGLALLSGEQAPVDELTTVGQLMGTLDYMAPEQLEDSHLVGPRADIYALSATLYRLLTGVAPFAKDDRKTPLQKLRALATQSAPPIRERRADLPEDLAAIIDRALRRDPTERFASMCELAERLTPWCVGQNLPRLAREATRLAVPSVGQVSNLPVLPSQTLPHRPPPATALPTSAGHFGNLPHNPRRRTWIASLLSVGVVFVLGVVITIQTNKGTLIVESVRDGVEVRVKRSGKPIEHLEVTTGPKSARLTAGEYEIEIVGDADGLQIQNGNFVLKRGDTVVAKITEQPKAAVAEIPAEVDKGNSPELPTEHRTRKPNEIVDRAAKGMDTFEESNLDLVGTKKIREALQKRIDVEFIDLPLADCLDFLKEQAGLEFFLDKEALTEEGIAQDSPCNLRLKEIRMATALEFLLRPMQLAWIIDQGQVLITSVARANERLLTRSYPVGRLLPGVRLAVERMKSEAPTLPPGFGRPANAGGGGGGGGFFQVGDAASTLESTREPFWIHRQFGGGAAPKPEQQNPNIATFVPTEGSHFKALLSESLGHLWLDKSGEGGACELLHNVLVVRQTWRAHAEVESLLRIIEAAFLKPLTEPTEIRPEGYSHAADAKLREQLAHTFEVGFTDTPLTDVAEWLSEKLGSPVLLETENLSEDGIATDTPVTLTFKAIPGDVLLSRLLQPLQLDYRLEDGLLVITTAAANRDRLVTKVYDVRDLFARGLHPNRLVSGLTETTSGPWEAREGEGGTITIFADTLLVIRQTAKIHNEVGKSIASLRSQLSDQPEVPIVVTPQPKTPLATQPNPPAPNEPKPTTATTTTPTADNQPRFDGKTFDEWLAILDTERSPARLTDAIEALRLLGRDTHAKHVAEQVLKASRFVDFDNYGSGGSRPALTAILRLFASLPNDVVQRAYAVEFRNGTSRSRKFLLGNFPAVAKIVADEYVEAILIVSRDSDPGVRESATSCLSRLPLEGSTAKYAEQRTNQLRQALNDNVSRIAFIAAKSLMEAEADSKAVAEALARIVGKLDPYQRLEALNLIAVMGPRAVSVASEVSAILLEPADGQEVRSGFGFGGFGGGGTDAWLGPFRSDRKSTWQFVAAMALARMGKEAATELPTIQKALDAPMQLTIEDRKGFSLNETFRLHELLFVVKRRIEEPPALDLRAGESSLDAGRTILAMNYQLLGMEAALLQQYRGPNHPSVKELAEKRETVKRDYDLINDLRDVRRFVDSAKYGKTKTEVVSNLLSLLQKGSAWGIDRPSGIQPGSTIIADSPRESAITELGKLGSAAREALPVLKKELESKDKSIAAAAEKAIKQIEAAKDDTKPD